jgi:surface antigen
MRFRLTLLAGALALSGCGTSGLAGRESSGVLGGLGPSGSGGGQAAVASSIISAMHGGLIGGSVGAGLSGSEKRAALEAEYKALEYTASGQAVAWKGNSGHRGEVVAAQPYQVGSQNCRQYTQTVFTGAASATARGTACRNPDGSWTPLT